MLGWLAKLWSWELIGIAAPFLYGLAATAMYGDQYALANTLYVVAISLLAAKVLAWEWEETRLSEKRKRYSLAVFILLLAVGLVFASLNWTDSRRQQIAQTEHPTKLPEQTKSEPPKPKPQEGPPPPTAKEIAHELRKLIPGLIPQAKEQSPTFKEAAEEVTISFGGNIDRVPLSRLQNHAIEPYNFAEYKPIRAYLENGKLFVDVSIYGGPNKSPIEVKRNNFTLRVPGWDRNFDSAALEIVNDKYSPVFQLIYRTPYQITVNGIFPSPSGLMLASNDGFLTSMPFIPKAFRITRLFKYPSNQFPGQREEIIAIVPKPFLKQRALSLSADLIKFVNAREEIFRTAPEANSRNLRETFSLFDDKFALKCAYIAEELAASNLDVGNLPSFCRSANNTLVMRDIANRLRFFAEQLETNN